MRDAAGSASLLVVLVWAAPALAGDYILYDDVQVAPGRHYRGQGNAGVTAWRKLWTGGAVNYYVDRTGTNPRNPAPPLPQVDQDIIARGIAHWETKTCIRFTECATESACAKPYMRFQSDASGCNSPVGVAWDEVNEINLSSQCGYGALVHEIGHSLGLGHEQSRNDRDDFVYIDFTQIQGGMQHNFDKAGSDGRCIGAYDYGSIMHYSAGAFSTGSLPTIVSAYPMGQRSGLSDGDVEGIMFMYHDCVLSFTAPTCIASQDAAVTHVIPQGKAWSVEFNGLYERGKAMTVSYAAATAPAAMVSSTVAEGGGLGDAGPTTVSFTPDGSVSGREYSLAATFTGEQGSVTCAVTVHVAGSGAVCFGLEATDPAVCSGRGTCVDDPLAPCQCNSGYGGVDCSAFADCPRNIINDFNDDPGVWSPIGAATIDPAHYVEGASWKVGEEGAGTAQAQLTPTAPSKPGKISFYMAAMAGTSPTMSFRDAAGNSCLRVGVYQESSWIAAGSLGGPVEAGRFYRIDITLDWDAGTVSYLADGDLIAAGSIGCTAGVSLVVFFGNGWLDDFKMLCSEYAVMTGSVTEGVVEQGALRAGGATITLTLVGDFDEWVDTDANKQAVIDALTGDTPAGWNQRRGRLLDVSLLTVDPADKQILRIGPLAADAGYDFAAGNTVGFTPAGGMFASGRAPQVVKEDLSFVVRGGCEASQRRGYDEASDLPSTRLAVSSTVKVAGAGALHISSSGLGFTYRDDFRGIRPGTGAMHVQVAEDSAQLNWKMGVVDMVFGRRGGQITVNDVTAAATISADAWLAVAFAFDWDAREVTVTFGSNAPETFAMKTGASIGQTSFYAWGAAYIDEVAFLCEEPPPAFSIIPACPTPDDGAVITVYPGTRPLSDTDTLAVVPAAAADCSTAADDCAALNACHPGTGAVTHVGAELEWAVGTLGLAVGDYKVCHYSAAAAAWTMAQGTFSACAGTDPTPAPPTSAPATPAPQTPAPPTNAPATSAPDTPAPPTSAPATPAPQTPAPPTSVPATLTPGSTVAPPTLAPATSAPPTAAPDTPAPPTSAPATPAPQTPAPPTNAPATSAPPTAAPDTSAPPTSAPATPAPQTPAPQTSVPATLTPGSTVAPPTLAPATSAPPTAAPDTPAPPTSAPATPAPQTPAPQTPTPATLTPGTTPAPATSAPATMQTVAPATSAPDAALATPIPDTAAPATAAPGTAVPSSTTAPATPAPVETHAHHKLCLSEESSALGCPLPMGAAGGCNLTEAFRGDVLHAVRKDLGGGGAKVAFTDGVCRADPKCGDAGCALEVDVEGDDALHQQLLTCADDPAACPAVKNFGAFASAGGDGSGDDGGAGGGVDGAVLGGALAALLCCSLLAAALLYRRRQSNRRATLDGDHLAVDHDVQDPLSGAQHDYNATLRSAHATGDLPTDTRALLGATAMSGDAFPTPASRPTSPFVRSRASSFAPSDDETPRAGRSVSPTYQPPMMTPEMNPLAPDAGITPGITRSHMLLGSTELVPPAAPDLSGGPSPRTGARRRLGSAVPGGVSRPAPPRLAGQVTPVGTPRAISPRAAPLVERAPTPDGFRLSRQPTTEIMSV